LKATDFAGEDAVPCEVQVGVLLDSTVNFPEDIKPDEWSRCKGLLYICDEDTMLSIGASHVIGYVDPDADGPEMQFSRHKYRGGILLMLSNDGVVEPFPTEKLALDIVKWFAKRQANWNYLYGTRAVQ
jgi:hypothetical protein